MCTKHSEVLCAMTECQIFHVRPDLTQSISILSYNHRSFPGDFLNSFAMKAHMGPYGSNDKSGLLYY